ncbi:exosome complex component RRP45-like isoform X2 [Sycon ciliatum]|uniref:exosome complex component RRP45-like isoform X2 n=1 Tax=Sycon ciliatum TaxID=27933 RepID=UPI0031F71CCC
MAALDEDEMERLDGRGIYDYRKISINLGHERGHAEVAIGNTRVLCQVSAEVVKPSGNRPTEGVLYFNVELSPMASASFEAGRSSPQSVQLSRYLEHAVKDSGAVDVETLCILADEKVWSIRVDVHVLDHCGGLATACSVAAIVALSHFRHPHATLVGEEVTIHSEQDHPPVPLKIYHMPICIAVAFFLDGKYMLLDPSWQEEREMDGSLTIGMNVHRDVCLLSTSGKVPLTKEQIMRCTQVASVKVAEMTEVIKKALAEESAPKQEKESTPMETDSSILTASRQQESVTLPPKSEKQPSASRSTKKKKKAVDVVSLAKDTAGIGLGGSSAWSDNDDVTVDRTRRKQVQQKKVEDGDNDSGEEETIVLTGESF